jgi:predicted acetyltransferase
MDCALVIAVAHDRERKPSRCFERSVAFLRSAFATMRNSRSARALRSQNRTELPSRTACAYHVAMVSLRRATTDDRVALENLMQLYAYDWSELRPLDVGENGRFGDYPLDVYWQEAWRHPFLLCVDGTLAGFALISTRSHLTGASDVADVAEFFVMRRFRRRGVGRAAALAMFDQFKGRWEIRQRNENVEATAFWRRIISEYKGGAYHEVRWNDAAWTGPVQRFSA